MEYTINKLARLAGVSTRTLRYYDECGLLTAGRISSNGYRIYGSKEVDRLQQILFYRELGVELGEINRILQTENYDAQKAMEGHLSSLKARRSQLDLLIKNVERTISAVKGENTMSDKEKFEGFKKKLVEENETKYGAEIRQKYGDEEVDASNAKVMGMTSEQYAEVETLTKELNEALKVAAATEDPACELAQQACELHKRWLCYYWKDYSKEAHVGVTRMYVEDPRFTEYYEKIAPGCALFLRDAVEIYCS
ncbi:MAG: MerR family transcriptional regulator [Lachnospiraceae bacterium]